jgi:hypothetical protein
METPAALLQRWLKRARESSFSHYAAEQRYFKTNLLIGVPATVFSAIVGTTVFASLEKDIDFRVKLLVGTISIIASILTGLQTFLRYSERAERHRKAGGNYSSIRRVIEQNLVFDDKITHDAVDGIRKQLDSVGAEAPNIPDSLWKLAEKRAAGDYFLSNSH